MQVLTRITQVYSLSYSFWLGFFNSQEHLLYCLLRPFCSVGPNGSYFQVRISSTNCSLRFTLSSWVGRSQLGSHSSQQAPKFLKGRSGFERHTVSISWHISRTDNELAHFSGCRSPLVDFNLSCLQKNLAGSQEENHNRSLVALLQGDLPRPPARTAEASATLHLAHLVFCRWGYYTNWKGGYNCQFEFKVFKRKKYISWQLSSHWYHPGNRLA